MTDKNFRSVLLDRMKTDNMSFRELSRLTNIPHDNLYSIKRRKDGSTQVETAMKIAQDGFDMTLDEFMGVEKSEIMHAISTSLSKLPLEEQKYLQELIELKAGNLGSDSE